MHEQKLQRWKKRRRRSHTSAAQSLQHAPEASTHMPIVMHMHTKHDAMRKLLLCTMEMLLDKKC